MDKDEVLKLFNNGNYNMCFKIFSRRPSSMDAVEPSEQSGLKLDQIEQTTEEYLYLNNAALCEAIIKQKTDENWSNTMTRFIVLHSNYRSLLTIPLELEMNVVYNMLWWFCVKPHSLRYKTLHYKAVLSSTSKCLIKVLKSCDEQVLGQEFSLHDETRVAELVQRASDHLLRLSPVACNQLLGIIMLIALVILRQEDTETSGKLMTLMKKAADQSELLKLHMQQGINSGNEEMYFKFGLTSVNSSASVRHCRSFLDAFAITGCVVCAMNKQFEHAMCCLKQVSEVNNSFKFLVNYLKAYCCLYAQHYSEAQLCLAYLASSAVSPWQHSHHRLLLGRLLSEQEDHQAALAQCEAVLASTQSMPELSSLAAHLAATLSQKLHLTTAQLNYLKQLVQFLKPSLSDESDGLEEFPEWCLSILSRPHSVSQASAIYTLARQLYLNGYHTKALESYKELLELFKSTICETSEHRPPRIQILQEALLAHVKTSHLEDGEQLSRKLVRGYVPSGTTLSGSDGEGKWEAALYQLEEDIVSLVLLADIIAATDKSKALEELNRAYNAVSESKDQAGDLEETRRELCDWLLSRILLRKAKLSGVKEAVHYFRRALLIKPGDKEVMFHYKQWGLWHPDHDSFDPGDRVEQFPEDQLQNLALRHVLGCSVSEEEWATLFDQQSSQNLLESLFDDDD